MKSSSGLMVLVLTKYCSQSPNSTNITEESTEKKRKKKTESQTDNVSLSTVLPQILECLTMCDDRWSG